MIPGYILENRFSISNPENDLIGRGGMGEVYRATDTQTGETVAVKVLNPEVVARGPQILERFLREGDALRQLNHPNIVRMLTALEEEGQHYLVMEYVGGGSLEALLEKQGRLSAEGTSEIALDLADALTRAHRLGILHRDLKPANVLLAEDGTPRLADFGIAYVTDNPRLTQPVPDLAQMAPDTPDALGYSAVRLFLQSARRVRPGFMLAETDLKYVARICRLVGGMPLGILLPAA